MDIITNVTIANVKDKFILNLSEKTCMLKLLKYTFVNKCDYAASSVDLTFNFVNSCLRILFFSLTSQYISNLKNSINA